MHKNMIDIGIEAVRITMPLLKKIQGELSGKESITKTDKSPVTIADFSSQAIICKLLRDKLPNIPIVGEEDSDALKKPENKNILEKIFYFTEGDKNISEIIDKNNLFESIDIGNGEPDDLFWTLDPIDGTKGFLRGEQFVIALGLIERGEVVGGILGCPNLHLESEEDDEGYIISAIKGEGSFLLNVKTNKLKTINVSKRTNTEDMRFVQSYESSHGNLELQNKIAKELGMNNPPIQMDSQVKYGLVATGMAEVYLRIPNPKSPDYKEKIWDHAAGSIIVQEAGGIVSDINGKKLDFGQGKTLKNNSGIIATTDILIERINNIINKNENL